MCLTIHQGFHPKNQAIITHRPLIVDKMLLPCFKEDVLMEWRAPSMFTEYKLEKLYEADFSYSDYYLYGLKHKAVEKGLHALRHGQPHWTRNNSGSLAYRHALSLPALIPTGSRIYLGIDNDVVSNQLIVFLDGSKLRQYLGVDRIGAPIKTAKQERESYDHVISRFGKLES